MTPRWRLRCPEGHAGIEMYRSSFRCKTCEETYDKSELRDLVEEQRRAES